MSDALLDQIRDVIQRDVNNRGLARDPHENLFTICREDFANACRSIAATPQPTITIVTGFFIPHGQPPCGETDGPLGALFLARAGKALGINAALVTDSFCRQALKIGVEASGLSRMVPLLTARGQDHPHGPLGSRAGLSVGLEKGGGDPFTVTDPCIGETFAPSFGLFLRPTHLLALERVGPGSDDRCRNMHGRDVSDEMAPADLLFERDLRVWDQVCTIGIGDGGNEIGMGKIPAEVIARNIPNGDRIACRVPTDNLIVAGVSNWGAYALAAGVAVLRRQCLPASLFDVERERELLRLMVEQGPLVDGVTGRQTVTVDGLAFDDYAEPLRRIGELLEKEQCSS